MHGGQLNPSNQSVKPGWRQHKLEGGGGPFTVFADSEVKPASQEPPHDASRGGAPVPEYTRVTAIGQVPPFLRSKGVVPLTAVTYRNFTAWLADPRQASMDAALAAAFAGEGLGVLVVLGAHELSREQLETELGVVMVSCGEQNEARGVLPEALQEWVVEAQGANHARSLLSSHS
jgi:hypothetical protein